MATSPKIAVDVPKVLDSSWIRFFCCLMNRYYVIKGTRQKKKNIIHKSDSSNLLYPCIVCYVHYYTRDSGGKNE